LQRNESKWCIWGQNDDKARSRQAGFDDHLVKPVEPAALESLLVEVRTADEKGTA
jgi:hypothetical protein